MPYDVRKNGACWEVVNRDTGEVKAKCTTKAKAQAQVRVIEEQEIGTGRPDKVTTLSNGTKANVYYKNRESYSGTK